MSKIVYVTVPLLKDDLDQLKKKTGEDTGKEAVSRAVQYYLENINAV